MLNLQHLKGNKTTDPDVNKSMQQIVADAGYIFESHPVTTKDGYKLNMYRIKKKTFKQGSPVAFLQHGVLDSAECWVMNYKTVAPAFQLIEAGYDVWLGNQRGSKFSIGHTTLDTSKQEYW